MFKFGCGKTLVCRGSQWPCISASAALNISINCGCYTLRVPHILTLFEGCWSWRCKVQHAAIKERQVTQTDIDKTKITVGEMSNMG